MSFGSASPSSDNRNEYPKVTQADLDHAAFRIGLKPVSGKQRIPREKTATMAIPKPIIKFTYEDYLNTPEDKRYELLDGELVTIPVPGERHQSISILLGWKLIQFASENSLGKVYHAPFDVVLSDVDVVQPDLLFVSNERGHIITYANIQGAPDLVVEILSTSTAERDRTFKRTLYAKYGVNEYWIVDTTAKDITVLLLGERGYEVVDTYGEGETLTSPALQGFTLNIGNIF